MKDIVQRLTTVAWNDDDELCSLAADEIERLRNYIAKHQELWNKQMLELSEYQARDGKLGTGIRAKLGADKTGEK